MITINAYRKAISHWGEEKQKKKTLEELIELHDEIVFDLTGTGCKERILSELADVMNMCYQLAMIYDFGAEAIIAEMERKMQRTTERIDTEEVADDQAANYQSTP